MNDFLIYFEKNYIKNGLVIDLLSSLLIVLIILVINRLITKIIHKYMDNVQKFYRIKKTVNYISVIILMIILFAIWFAGVGSISTFLGLISAGIAIALKDLIINFVGWLFIITKRPFEVGDRIEINNCAGDVIDQRIFQFTLMEIGNWVDGDQSTGRIVHIPNSKVFTENLANFTKTFKYIWNEISITVTFESDWQKAKDILLDIIKDSNTDIIDDAKNRLKEASLKYMMLYKNLTPIVYTSIEEYGVKLTIRYLCEPRKRRTSIHNINEQILLSLKNEPNINLAYPTKMIYYTDLKN